MKAPGVASSSMARETAERNCDTGDSPDHKPLKIYQFHCRERYPRWYVAKLYQQMLFHGHSINPTSMIQGSNDAEITVSNYTGQGGHLTLKASIEETLGDNAISGSLFSRIRGMLEVTPRDLNVTNTLASSNGIPYTARRKVCLFTKAPGGWRSENLDFYIIDAQEKHVGRYGIVLGKASADKLFLNDTSKHVAPTYLDKGNG